MVGLNLTSGKTATVYGSDFSSSISVTVLISVGTCGKLIGGEGKTVVLVGRSAELKFKSY